MRTCELWARHCCAPDSRAPPPHDAQHFLVVASRSRLCLFLTKNRCRLTRMRASHYSSFSDTLLSLPSSSAQPLPGCSGLLRPSYLPGPFTIFVPGSGLAFLASLLRSGFLGGPASLTLAPPTLACSSSFCELSSSTDQAHDFTDLLLFFHFLTCALTGVLFQSLRDCWMLSTFWLSTPARHATQNPTACSPRTQDARTAPRPPHDARNGGDPVDR